MTLKMQTWSLSKLLLIISLLNIIPSVNCQGCSASWRSEACCGSELHNFWLWIRESCIGPATRFLHQDRAHILLVAGCSRFQPCLKLPSVKGGCLMPMTDENGEWRGNPYSTPLAQFGTPLQDEPNSTASCAVCWAWDAPAAVQTLPPCQAAPLTPTEEWLPGIYSPATCLTQSPPPSLFPGSWQRFCQFQLCGSFAYCFFWRDYTIIPASLTQVFIC